MRRDQRLGRDLQLLRASHQVRLMRLQKAHDRRQHRGLARALAQVARIEAGQVEQALCTFGFAERPDQRPEREGGGVGCILSAQIAISRPVMGCAI